MLNFTAIDFETANPKRGSVCQVGVARVRDGRIISSVGSLVTPPPGLNYFAPRNIEVHGILPHHVQGAPGWDLVAPWLEDTVGEDILVAHNAAFERSVITQANTAVGLEPATYTFACSMKLARRLDLPVDDHKLGTLMRHYDLPAGRHHDAEADAVMSARLMLALAEDIATTDINRLIV